MSWTAELFELLWPEPSIYTDDELELWIDYGGEA